MSDIKAVPVGNEIMALKSVPTDYPINRLTTLKRVNTCFNGVALEMRFVKISADQSESRSNLRSEVPERWYLAPSSYVKLVTDGQIVDNAIDKFTARDVVKSHSMDVEHSILPYALLPKYIQCAIRSLEKFTICRKVGSNAGVLNLNMIIGLFAKHDAFKSFYDDYITDLDTNVSLAEDDYDGNLVPAKYHSKYEIVSDENDIPEATAKVQAEGSKKQVVKLSNMISTYLMAAMKSDGVQNMGPAQTTPKLEDLSLEFLVMMVVISSCKTYVSLDHLRKYFENRGSPFSQVFAASNFNYNDLLTKQIVIEDYLNLAQKMNYFPRLKVSIFRYIITVPGLMCNYVRKMIRNAQSSVFFFIYLFLTTRSKTKGHFKSELRGEILNYLKVYRQLQSQYGDQICYVKLLNPEEEKMNNDNWRLLSAYAILWTAIKSNFTTMQNFISTGSSDLSLKDIKDLFTPLSPDCYKDYDGSLELDQEIRTFMGVRDGVLTFEYEDLETNKEFIEEYAGLLKKMNRNKNVNDIN